MELCITQIWISKYKFTSSSYKHHDAPSPQLARRDEKYITWRYHYIHQDLGHCTLSRWSPLYLEHQGFSQQQKLVLETQAQLTYTFKLTTHPSYVHILKPSLHFAYISASTASWISPQVSTIEPFTKGPIPKVTHCTHVYVLLWYDIWIISLGLLMNQTKFRQPPSSLYRI